MEGERIGLFVDGADVLFAFGTGSVMQEGAAGAGVRINDSQCRLDYCSNHILKSRFMYSVLSRTVGQSLPNAA